MGQAGICTGVMGMFKNERYWAHGMWAPLCNEYPSVDAQLVCDNISHSDDQPTLLASDKTQGARLSRHRDRRQLGPNQSITSFLSMPQKSARTAITDCAAVLSIEGCGTSGEKAAPSISKATPKKPA